MYTSIPMLGVSVGSLLARKVLTVVPPLGVMVTVAPLLGVMVVIVSPLKVLMSILSEDVTASLLGVLATTVPTTIVSLL